MDWVPCHQEYLDSLLFLEGRGEALVVPRCPLCWEPGALLCCKCTLAIHENLPLHNIQVWTGQMFEHTSLRGLGLTVQLGHPAYQKCPVPVYASSLFIVIHMNRHWFLSMVLQLKSCAMFEVLHQYQLLSLSSKISIHHFYDMLKCLTNNTGLVPVPVWHLKMLKQAGHGNDPSGVLGTASGKLVVICPACPEPRVNLPEEWMNTPEEERFLYDGIYAIDVNFHLKNRVRSSVDPGLGTRWAYFQLFVCLSVSPQISSCAGFAVLDHANTKKSDRLQVTGIGAIICTCHGLLHPNGIGDLQKGEQFCNMDYIMFSSLQGTKLGCIMILYNIFCQWITKLHCQLPSLPPEFQIDPNVMTLSGVIPKFHFGAHKPEGHAQFSLNWMPGGIERDWSGINPAANSMKEMGSGCQHDTLDDIWSDLNY
ncbi:hypothetical protein BS47DRAFT_1372602 [Hydnum rufescens UP504]|uniref:CxC2-like cysteine cluster KDZ transposase-associated domain-containing protein n=1 Tax=Hydnum rufescens UP504 TaxID=1448309 RepID=A0A9P6AWD3_9AGAM|nr:hypothetical protein BS47DRAFT_1372602 [Hydnum rufescens UP504]